jgi:PilZ domain
MSSTPVAAGKSVLIRMNRSRLPNPLIGTVIWEGKISNGFAKDGVTSSLYKAGIQFKGVTTGALVQLKDFMRVAGIPEETPYAKNDKQVALRYAITTDEGAMVNYATTYTVKKISMSGMLVEANCKLETEQKYPMALLLPNESQPVKFNGRVASLYQFPGRESYFDIGIEFHNLTEQGKTRLKRFIASLLWKHNA